MASRPPKRVRAEMRRYDDVIRSQVYLERFKAALVKDFDSAILGLQDEMTGILSKLKTENLGDLNRQELNGLLQTLRNAELEAYNQQLARLGGQLQELGNYSSAREATQLDDWATRMAKAANISNPAASTVWSYVQAQPIAATGELLGDFLDSYKDGAVARMEGVVRNGWAQGKTTADIIRQLRGTKAKDYKDGLLLGKDRQYAEAIARTSVQHVANAARQKTWEQNSDIVQGYMWISALDSRTSTQCRSLDRKRFKLNKGPLPPIHVNCRSTTIADVGDEWDWLDEGATRSSEFGYVPADKSYYEWLKTQDAEFVKDALGKKRAELFLNGGISADKFAELNLGKNFEPLSLAEMKQRDAVTFKNAGVEIRTSAVTPVAPAPSSKSGFSPGFTLDPKWGMSETEYARLMYLDENLSYLTMPKETLEEYSELSKKRRESMFEQLKPLQKKLGVKNPAEEFEGIFQMLEDPDLDAIIRKGKDYPIEGMLKTQGVGGECHWNVAKAYQKGEIDDIVIGYTNGRGAWYQHTWGLKDGKIVETTQANYYNLKYFGVTLSKNDADKFAEKLASKEYAPGNGKVRNLSGGPMVAAGYHPVSGLRGVVSNVSAQENEVIWVQDLLDEAVTPVVPSPVPNANSMAVPIKPTPKAPDIFKTTKDLDDWYFEYENAMEMNDWTEGYAGSPAAVEAATKYDQLTKERINWKELHRGMVFEDRAAFEATFKRGETVTFKRFSSAATNRDLASIYTRPEFIGQETGYRTMLVFKDKQGLRGHVSTATDWDGLESEVILPRNSQWKVVDVAPTIVKDGNVTYPARRVILEPIE